MNETAPHLPVLNVAQADHEILSKAIRNVRKLFIGDHPPDAAHQFNILRQLLTKKIAEHFADEENRLFPALLATEAGPKIAPILAELQQDHVQLLAEAQRLNTLLQDRTIAQRTGESWTALLDFFTVFEKHVAKEDRLFQAFQ